MAESPIASRVILEPAAEELVRASAKPPFLFQLPPEKGRKILEQAQTGSIAKLEIEDKWINIPGGPGGDVLARIVRPAGARESLPVILYIHGGGWVFGSARTHDRLLRELAIGAQAAVVFPEYSLSPERRYPTAIEESYAVARWITREGRSRGMDSSRMAIAGDSVGGNMAAALTLLAKERRDVSFLQQILFYPVTDASFDTPSYRQFATGYVLQRDGMRWYWDQYAPNPQDREQITASPLQATLDQLRGLPQALVITGEADVLRDEGEAYAVKLREAGVPVTAVRYGGIIHDFVMLSSLRRTRAADAAIHQAIWMLRTGFGTSVARDIEAHQSSRSSSAGTSTSPPPH